VNLSHDRPFLCPLGEPPDESMDHHRTAAALFENLYAIEELGPGQKPIALDKARGTLKEWAEHGDACIQREARSALRCFETWFSARKWNRGRDRGTFARLAVVDAISKLCNAVESLPHRTDHSNDF
jgi:hypothetical protein